MIGEAGDANVKVSGGCILIEDVHFDESAIEDLIFPVTDHNVPALKLKTLHVKKLAVNIPWGNFSKGFVDIELDGLNVLFSRRPASEVTAEVIRARKEACVAELMTGLVEAVTSMSAGGKTAKKKADDREAAGDGKKKVADNNKPGPNMPSWVLGLIRKILESFRPIIRLTNVHIRFEDLDVHAPARLALGLTIGKLIVQHPDSPYSEIDEDPDMMPVRDVVDLEVAVAGVGVYMHTHTMGATTVVGGGPAAQAAAQLAKASAPALTGAAAKRAAASNDGEDDRTVEAMNRLFGQMMRGQSPHGAQQWIIAPIAISGKVHVNVGIFIGAPTRFEWPHMIVADLTIEAIKVALSEKQAAALVIATSELAVMPARYLYQLLRPKTWRPGAAWRAAIHAVLGTLVEVSGATRLHNAIRDRMRYQATLKEAMTKMRSKDATAGTQLEDVMHVTTETKGKINLAEVVKKDSGKEDVAAESAVEKLLEVDALTHPMQIALWRLVAWAQAKNEAERSKLESKGKRRLLGAALASRAASTGNADEMSAAAAAMSEEVEPEEGDDPLAGAPLDFEMVVANLRLPELSVHLLLDDSAKQTDSAQAPTELIPMPMVELAAQAAAAASDPAAKTITTITHTANLDGSITTTTTVTTFKKPVTDNPLSTVLALSLTPVVVRARIAPKSATGIHFAVGEILLEHQIGRGSDETQPIIRFHGSKDIPNTSSFLGPPMPIVEVPRSSGFGFLGSAAASKAKARAKAKAQAPPAVEAEGVTGDVKAKVVPLPPALHLVASLPVEPPAGEMLEDGSLDATAVIHRGEARFAPHQLRELFLAFFTPLDTAMEQLPFSPITREMLFEMREIAEGFLVKPWWGILNALPAVIEGVREVTPNLLPLNLKVEISEGLQVHLLGEPTAETNLGLRHTVPLGTIELPPISASMYPAETESEKQVRIKLGLLGDCVLATPKIVPPLRPLSGPGAAPNMDPSQLSSVLLSEQMQLLDELKRARDVNHKLTQELEAHQAKAGAMNAELHSFRSIFRGSSPAKPPASGNGAAGPTVSSEALGSPAPRTPARELPMAAEKASPASSSRKSGGLKLNPFRGRGSAKKSGKKEPEPDFDA